MRQVSLKIEIHMMYGQKGFMEFLKFGDGSIGGAFHGFFLDGLLSYTGSIDEKNVILCNNL